MGTVHILRNNDQSRKSEIHAIHCNEPLWPSCHCRTLSRAEFTVQRSAPVRIACGTF
jgi:hypothetical protein